MYSVYSTVTRCLGTLSRATGSQTHIQTYNMETDKNERPKKSSWLKEKRDTI